jgi:signal transduction histidine kinase
VLPAVVLTVREALKLPYVAIELERDGRFETVAAAGEPVDDPPRLPLIYRGEEVGRLALGTRTGDDAFGPADRRLLDDLAHQIGVAVHAVRLADEALQLSADLQRSRERLVTAREEERRRLRRDLHDGLGPRLAAQTLKVGSARSLYPQDPAAADALLAGLETDIEEALTDIRRLVYDLRPPALDELGLVGAVREATAQYREDGLSRAPERLPLLPAAVEVAAYRIVQEALTNVVRHAHAGSCLVRLSLGDVVELEITDDGVGLPADRRAGVGLSSMRERAAELGGKCVIEPLPSGGARVLARLPLPKRDKPTGAQADDDGSLKDRA